VKITPDGKLKVLDFGLAKAFEAETSKANVSQSPTLSMAATNAGVILGTAAYMSPEQAKGQHVDRRTDIFALGAVLYETLTGTQAFAGDTVSDILSRVILAEPDWSRLPKKTPANVRHLLKRCLHKDRNLRLRDAGDVKLEILAPQVEVEPAAPRGQGRERVAWIVALIAAAAVGAISAALVFRAPAVDALETRLEIVTPPTANLASFAISPDGRKIVFAATVDGQTKLWLRLLDGTAAQVLEGTEDGILPFWSPDSKSIGFFAVGSLKRLDLAGGLPQKLADLGGANAGGGSWSPDGVILFAGSNVTRVPASAGQTMPATKLEAPVLAKFPQFLPDGRQFLFNVSGGTPEATGVYLGSLDSSETKRLTSADAQTLCLYVEPGWLFFVRQGTLLAQRFDSVRSDLLGDPVAVADQVNFSTGTGNSAAFSASATGVIAYRSGGASSRQLTWYDRSGNALGPLGAAEPFILGPTLSRDGRRAAVGRNVQTNRDVWIFDMARTTQLTFDAAIDQFPLWSPDGAQIVFDSNRKGTRDLYLKSSDGSGSDELLVESPRGKSPVDWSRDGRFILYWVNEERTLGDLWIVPMQGARKPEVFLNTDADERAGQFSPDSRFVAYHSNESGGRLDIYVRPFRGPGQWLVSAGGGVQPRWSADGKELYYIAPGGKLMSVPIVVKGAAIEHGVPMPLFQTRIWDGGSNFAVKQQYDVAPDGRFLINISTADEVTPITVVLNWRRPSP